MKLTFAKPLSANSTATHIRPAGKPLVKSNIAKGATNATINISNAATMSRGIYIITLTDNGKQYRVKLMTD